MLCLVPLGFIFPPRLILPPYHFAPWKLLNDLHYLPTSHIIFPPGFILPHIILPPYYFTPSNRLMIYTIYPCPISSPPSPRDSFCPYIILPPYNFAPGNRLMINTIYPCPISFFPQDSFCPYIILPPYHFAPWRELFNDLHYFTMSRIILPPGFILPHIILPWQIV